MNYNVQTVFEFIRRKCIDCEDASVECYHELSDFVTSHIKSSSSIFFYLNKLTVEGVIKFDHLSKTIMLTRKGKQTESLC